MGAWRKASNQQDAVVVTRDKQRYPKASASFAFPIGAAIRQQTGCRATGFAAPAKRLDGIGMHRRHTQTIAFNHSFQAVGWG